MRILTVLDVGHPTVGGTQIKHRTLLRDLARRHGHTCAYLDRTLTPRRRRRGRILEDAFRDLAELREKVEAYEPDVLFGGFTAIHHVVKLGRALGVPTVGFLDSYEYCPPTPRELRDWKLLLDHPYPPREAREFALRHADCIVANSHYMQRRLRERTGHDSEVVHPGFDDRSFLRRRRPPKRGAVVGVCGHPHKGADVFLELARRFPDERFLVVGAVHADWFPRFRDQPNVEILPFRATRTFLARARVVLVPSQWAEPFGRVAVEAMASGIPTLVSHAAGLAEIAGDSELGVRRYREADAWERALAPLLRSRAAAERNAETGRKRAAPFVEGRSGDRLDRLVRKLAAARRPAPRPRRRVIALVGRRDAKTAFARMNSPLARCLAALPDTSLHGPATLREFVPEPVDCFVHHDYSVDFGSLELPEEGHFVALRTWDFGPFPPAWVERIEADCDQLWVHSRWVRAQAIRGGVRPGRVEVIPWAIAPERWRPDGPRLPLPTDKTVKLLFVGATVLRKGIDVLLDAYRQAFDRSDDVCLVIKDNPRDVFYEGLRWRDEILERSRTPDHPEIVYLDDELSEEAMASLYRACDVGVFPYRAEGFALPILEGMACGLPSLVPRFGASLDFCSRTTSFPLPAKRIALPVSREMAYNTLGFREEIEEVDFCEVPVATLAESLRRVAALAAHGAPALSGRAAAGVRVAHERFPWSRTRARIERALARLERRRTPVRMQRVRRERRRNAGIFRVARQLYLRTEESAGLPVRRHR